MTGIEGATLRVMVAFGGETWGFALASRETVPSPGQVGDDAAVPRRRGGTEGDDAWP